MTELAQAHWPALGAPELVLVPLGSTEQHGPHLPFDTDAVIATAVARGLAERLRVASIAVVVAPALPYGASGEHQDFPGTTSIGEEALALVIVELARSLRTWAPRVVFVNGHGGNVRALTDAVAQLVEEGHDAAWVPCGVAGGDAHAGRTETSLLLHLAPASVDLAAAERGVVTPIGELLPELRRQGVRGVAPNGVLGDPTGASAAEGARLLAAMVDAAAGALNGINGIAAARDAAT
ncbi:mycofactocin biosynthesis peptidyl-dipeptidase MftE [Gryllotalpicola koreensis]|uniref:Mycofactocin biosynthesis peptidyl-dipeptidase MftE n=1 Tax=Gryllotalpicola koreensis TaxID=993086 RepID=A0ABP7ZRU1_9MICO